MILVTGAGGFVGKALCWTLSEQGEPFKALYRSRPPEGIRNAVLIQADLLAPVEAWRSVLAGVETVIHLAGAHQLATNDEAVWMAVNTNATLNLARAAAAAGVRRFVYVSSVKALGEGGEITYRDGDAPHPEDAYGRSKLQAEQGLQQLAAETGIEVVVLRPPLIYGPGVDGNFLRLLRAVDRGYPLPLACVKNRRSMIFVGNFASALIACARPGSPTGVFLVSDDGDVSTPQLVRKIGSALRVKPRLLPVPAAAFRILTFVLRRPGMYRRLFGSLSLSNEGFKQSFNWGPPYSLDEALRISADWYRAGQAA